MSAPAPRIVEEGTDTLLTVLDFGTVIGGAESAELEFDVENDGALAETLTETSIGVTLESTDGGTTWTVGQAALGRWVEIQAYGVAGTGIAAQATGYIPTGDGARLILDPIPGDTRRKLRAKAKLPADAGSVSLKVKIGLNWRAGYIPLGQGLYEAGIHGVTGGTNDPTYSALLSGGELTATGTPDGNVQVADYAAKVGGVPLVKYAHAKALAASASGMARWVTLSIAANNTVTATASAEVAAPAPITDRPAVPAGEPFLGWVHRDDGTIVTGDIYAAAADVPRSPFTISFAGLVGTFGQGGGIVDNNLVWRQHNTEITFTDDQASVVYLQRDSTVVAVEAGTSMAPGRPEPMWALEMASGSLVAGSLRDLRTFMGPPRHIFEAAFPGAAVDDTAVLWRSPVDRALYVRLPVGVALSARVIGDRTAGALHVPLERWNGSSWDSLFSSTTKDPQLAFDATVLAVQGFLPDTVAVPAGSLLRLRQETTSLTGGTTNPADVFARVEFEEAAP